MSFELAGARLLMPHFGMGMEVWAVVIATTLGALAAGYWIGGRIADARPGAMTLCTALLLTSVLLIFVRVWGRRVTAIFENMSLVAGACLSGILILCGPLLLLGMVQPILARLLVRTTLRTGAIVGGLMAAGTLGGIFGTMVTGLVLIPHFGISKTLLILVVVTMVFAVLLLVSGRSSKAAWAAVIAAGVTVGAGLSSPVGQQAMGPMQVLESVEGRYGYLEVLEHHGTVALVCNGVFQTVLPVSGLGIMRGTLIRGRDYIELLPYFRPGTRTALLIGVGGGLHAQSLAFYGIEVHGVEVEPAVIPLAVEYFGLAAEVTAGDGRAFLARQQRRFDAIVLDAFVGGAAPEHLFTKEAFEEMGEHLNPDGVLAIRLIGQPGHRAIRAVARTVEKVFGHTVAVRSGIGSELQHVFLFAGKAGLKLGSMERLDLAGYGFTGEEFCDINTDGAALLTDDKSGLMLLSSDIVAAHRKNCLRLRREPLW
jgi:spermidine synthase